MHRFQKFSAEYRNRTADILFAEELQVGLLDALCLNSGMLERAVAELDYEDIADGYCTTSFCLSSSANYDRSMRISPRSIKLKSAGVKPRIVG